MSNHLWKAVVDLVEVSARDFPAIDTRQHGHVVAFAGAASAAASCQFVGCDQPGAERSGKILALTGTEVELHIQALEVTRAPVVHDGVTRYVVSCFLDGYILALASDDAGYFKLDIQFVAAFRIRNLFIRTVDFTVVGKVERRYLIPFRDHICVAQGSRCPDMLLEGVESRTDGGSGMARGVRVRSTCTLCPRSPLRAVHQSRPSARPVRW